MKKHYLYSIPLMIIAIALLAAATVSESPYERYTANFEEGAPDFKTIGELSFGPEGILFFGDSPGAAIYALDTNDRSMTEAAKEINIENLEKKVAQKMGVTAAGISFRDLAVNPTSQKIYISLTRGQGNSATYHLVKVTADGMVREVALDNVKFSKFALNSAPSADATDRRGRSLRAASITDLAFSDDKVFVAGLSNEEFSSGFRTIEFPFKGKESLSTLEIFHVSHGQFETNAPIRTFVPYNSDEGNYIVAGFTCTPLVIFPMDKMTDGQHVKGKTVAELGNRNTPLDIISYTDSSGNPAMIIANSSRSTMRLNPKDFKAQNSLEEPMPDDQETVGVGFESLSYSNVMQIADLDKDHLVMLQRQDDNSVTLRSVSK